MFIDLLTPVAWTNVYDRCTLPLAFVPNVDANWRPGALDVGPLSISQSFLGALEAAASRGMQVAHSHTTFNGHLQFDIKKLAKHFREASRQPPRRSYWSITHLRMKISEPTVTPQQQRHESSMTADTHQSVHESCIIAAPRQGHSSG